MFVALLLLGHVSHDPVIADRVDMIELNHVFDVRGEHVLDQVIFWDWEGDNGWHIAAHHYDPESIERPQRSGDAWLYVWHARSAFRMVEAPMFRETWSNYDPEIAERDRRPECERRGLCSTRTD